MTDFLLERLKIISYWHFVYGTSKVPLVTLFQLQKLQTGGIEWEDACEKLIL
jgi:hypothetical protein